VKKAIFQNNPQNRGFFKNSSALCFLIGLGLIISQATARTSRPSSRARIKNAVILTQIPSANHSMPTQIADGGGKQQSLADWSSRLGLHDKARLIKINPDSSTKVLTKDFHSACDPDISFDASHFLFAGKKTKDDNWNIFEMSIDGSRLRQVTNESIPCRSPGYQSTLYTIVSPKPWQQLTFVGSDNGLANLYSCKLDGTEVRRLTFNVSCNMDPYLMYDGRLLFASLQRSSLDTEAGGRISLFGIGIDGTDYAAFCTEEGKLIKHMPCVTTRGLAVFVESDILRWDAAGTLGAVSVRRPLHSYRPVTTSSDGLFHSPSPLPGGKVLVSRRSSDGSDTHGVYVLDPSTKKSVLIFDAPAYHDLQAKIVHPRPEPDGRSSVVTEKDPNGKLYCLDVYISDLDKPQWLPPQTVKRLRVLEGVSSTPDNADDHTPIGREVLESYCHSKYPLVQTRILGEIDIADDGSFNIEIPADTPVKLQTLDADGMALRTCDWIWAENHEPRGCIGCHEDGELTPENALAKAVTRSSIKLTLPPERRRTVDFRRDIVPIIEKKCIRCHSHADDSAPLNNKFSLVSLSDKNTISHQSYASLLAKDERTGKRKYVRPASARTSPLIWHIFGRNTSRPWDDTFSKRKVPEMPPDDNLALTDYEKRIFVQWIDMGALWDGIPGPDNLPQHSENNAGGGK
jgi:hypothetical protein